MRVRGHACARSARVRARQSGGERAPACLPPPPPTPRGAGVRAPRAAPSPSPPAPTGVPGPAAPTSPPVAAASQRHGAQPGGFISLLKPIGRRRWGGEGAPGPRARASLRHGAAGRPRGTRRHVRAVCTVSGQAPGADSAPGPRAAKVHLKKKKEKPNPTTKDISRRGGAAARRERGSAAAHWVRRSCAHRSPGPDAVGHGLLPCVGSCHHEWGSCRRAHPAPRGGVGLRSRPAAPEWPIAPCSTASCRCRSGPGVSHRLRARRGVGERWVA